MLIYAQRSVFINLVVPTVGPSSCAQEKKEEKFSTDCSSSLRVHLGFFDMASKMCFTLLFTSATSAWLYGCSRRAAFKLWRYFLLVCIVFDGWMRFFFWFASKISEATFCRWTAANTEDLSRKNCCCLIKEMLRGRHFDKRDTREASGSWKFSFFNEMLFAPPLTTEWRLKRSLRFHLLCCLELFEAGVQRRLHSAPWVRYISHKGL